MFDINVSAFSTKHIHSLLILFAVTITSSLNAQTVAIDEAHNNWHTKDGRYKPFSGVLQTNGFKVFKNESRFSEGTLESVDILVIANAIHESDIEHWALPNASAFSREEIEVIHRWVNTGGSLMLVADHFPFAQAAASLAASFGFYFNDGYVYDESNQDQIFSIERGNLIPHPILNRSTQNQAITQIVAFTGSAFLPPPDASVLMVLGEHAKSRMPADPHDTWEESLTLPVKGFSQGAVLEFGQGRLAIFAEAAMFTEQVFPERTIDGKQYPERIVGFNAPGAQQNKAFLLNVMQWLSERSEEK